MRITERGAFHWHGIVTDRTTSLSDFCHRLHLFVAKLLNVGQRRGENFWAARPFSSVRLVDPEDVLDKMVYVLTNTVKDGLVDRLEDWPGFHTTPEDVGVTVLVGRKPDWFFRKPREDQDEPESTVPDRVEIRVTRPPAFADLTDEEFRELLRGRVEQRIAEIRQEREAQGRPHPLGADAVLAQDPFSRPGWSEVDRGVTPRAACKDKWRRIEALTTLKTFFAEYRAAWRAWADARTEEARRAIVFPAGTYWMRRVYGVTCAPAPT